MTRTVPLRGLAAVLVALLVLAGPVAGAPDDPVDPKLLLSRARDKENEDRDYPGALELYTELLERTDLEEKVLGDALLGSARCQLALENYDEAQALLERILEDGSLPIDKRDKAENLLVQLKAQRTAPPATPPGSAEEVRLAKLRKAQAAELVEEAKRARDELRFEDAKDLCQMALELDPENVDAVQVQTQVVAATPDVIDLVRNLLRFVTSTRAAEFRRVRTEYDRLETAGRDLFKVPDYEGADGAFRKAIQLVDESKFAADLATERAQAIRWLGTTIEKAAAAGIDLGDVPPMPETSELAPSFQRRMFDLLSGLFLDRPGDEYPLQLYDAAPARLPADGGDAAFAAGSFPEGVSAAREDGAITRAEWAEHWIRSNVGTRWATPGQDGSRTGPPRFLDRVGTRLIVQHDRSTHDRVAKLLAGFSPVHQPMTVDVALFATTVAGATRIVSALGAKARPRESGAALVAEGWLIEDCVPLVEHAEGVQPLGRARFTLARRPSAVLSITQPADRHPDYQSLPAPPLVIDVAEARFGLWLEVFAEDLVRAPGDRRAAVAVRATTRVPQGTFVVPRAGVEGEWTRHARPMAEQGVTAERRIPHMGTLLIQGLSNPFPGGSETHPGLVVLVGVRPAPAGTAAGSVPDTPRDVPRPSENGGREEHEYDLGPLATEVVDAAIDRSWPQRPASAKIPAGTLRKAREAWLAVNLGVVWGRLVRQGQPSPVKVWGRTATARVTPEQHARLQQVVDALRAHDTALYQVDVISAEVTEPVLSEWVRTANARMARPNAFVASGAPVLQALEASIRGAQKSGFYALQARLLARATQRVLASNLHTQSIVEDMQVWRHSDGSQRQIPVQGTAEEGLVVLVRPELETEGRRLVAVDVKGARLRNLEPLLLPQVEQPAARISIPRHHPVQGMFAAEPLGDEEALLLAFPHPENNGRIIVVYVRTTRVQ